MTDCCWTDQKRFLLQAGEKGPNEELGDTGEKFFTVA